MDDEDAIPESYTGYLEREIEIGKGVYEKLYFEIRNVLNRS